MALPRESAFLPTIKCSNCGNEVEISLMGEHLCDGPATPELSPPLENDETFENAYQATRTKYLRTPPLVDTGAANRYQNHGQLTPVSQPSSSRNASPKTPSGRSGINRKYDDEYAPEIARQDDGRPSPRGYGQRPGGYGGFNSQTTDHDISDTLLAKEAPGLFPRVNDFAGGYGGFGVRPTEPEKPAVQESAPETPGFLQRINDMAGAAFDAGRRPSATKKAAFPQRKDSLDHWDAPPDLTVPYSNQQKLTRQNGYGGFSDVGPGENASRGMTRAETFPKHTSPPNDINGRRPSAPGQQSEINRRPSAPFLRTSDINRRPSMGPDTSRRPPPRTSLIRAHGNSSSVDLDKEFGARNPYHTPTDSMSSGYSTASEHSTKASSNGSLDRIDREKSDAMSQSRQPQPQPQPQQQQQQLPQRNNNTARPQNNARPELRIDPAIQAPQRSAGRFVESPYSVSPRDDCYDPAIQHGMLTGIRGQQFGSPPRQLGLGGGYGSNKRSDRQAAPIALPVRKASRDPLHVPSRGDCKACHMPITGKSISSADGRLTGKYHKACFVCTTCSEPFSSAEFYVHSDKPYCEIHYHKLNGSLCGTCQRGIEGQYLEDEVRIKYHVGCFRCLDCGMSLSDGYFEIDGKSYCERDARRRNESTMEVLPPLPVPMNKQPPPAMPIGTMAPPTINRAPSSRGMAALNTGAGMERGPYGVAPGNRGDRPRLNKRMTRIGVM